MVDINFVNKWLQIALLNLSIALKSDNQISYIRVYFQTKTMSHAGEEIEEQCIQEDVSKPLKVVERK